MKFLLMAAQEGGSAWAAALADCIDTTMRLDAAREILQHVELQQEPPTLEALRWCFDCLSTSQDEADVSIARRALEELQRKPRSQLLSSFEDVIERSDPGHPVEQLLVDVVVRAPPGEGCNFFRETMFKSVLEFLSPFAHEQRFFEVLFQVVESGSNLLAGKVIVNTLLNCLEKRSLIYRLDPTRAERVARVLVSGAVHAGEPLRFACAGALFYFNHRGAEAFLMQALNEYGAVNAEKQSDPERRDKLETVVANLYSAVRNLRTPAALRAIAERLFSERREYWRLGDALGTLCRKEPNVVDASVPPRDLDAFGMNGATRTPRALMRTRSMIS